MRKYLALAVIPLLVSCGSGKAEPRAEPAYAPGETAATVALRAAIEKRNGDPLADVVWGRYRDAATAECSQSVDELALGLAIGADEGQGLDATYAETEFSMGHLCPDRVAVLADAKSKVAEDIAMLPARCPGGPSDKPTEMAVTCADLFADD